MSKNITTIHRAIKNKDNPYTIMKKSSIQDVRLSWQAKGLLAYMLSLPDDWDINAKELQKHAPNGRDVLYKILNELIEAGYIVRKQIKNTDGKFNKYITLLFEDPQTVINPGDDDFDQDDPLPGFQDTAKPAPVVPFPEKPLPGFQEQLNKDKLITDPLIIINRSFSSQDTVQEPAIQPQKQSSTELFEEFWSLYPVKTAKKRARATFMTSVKSKEGSMIINALRAQILERGLLIQYGLFCPEFCHPTTWLNGERWNDLVMTEDQIARKASSSSNSRNNFKQNANEAAKRLSQEIKEAYYRNRDGLREARDVN